MPIAFRFDYPDDDKDDDDEDDDDKCWRYDTRHDDGILAGGTCLGGVEWE